MPSPTSWHRLPQPLLDYSRPLLMQQQRLVRGSRFCSTAPRAGAEEQQRQQRKQREGDDDRTAVKLRFAPSPTGYLHLGGLRTALFNHLLARRLGGSWTLRIEDTDRSRYVSGAVESLLKTLNWAKLSYDEGPDKDLDNGPYFQSQRAHIYDRFLQPLIDSGKAYHCFCSSERLASTRRRLQMEGSNATYDRKCLGLSQDEVKHKLNHGEQSVVRFKSSSEGLTQHDLVYDPITYDSLPIEDFVLRKSDGLPTYHFANVVDDHSMGVTHVLRGEEWLPSTPKHLALYAALGLRPPLFAHLPLLVNPDGSKLSKRAGDVRVEDYIDRGYEPEALLNFVALMGWSPQATTKTNADASGEAGHVLSIDEMIQKFSLEGVNKNRATMSLAKLEYLNREHVKRKLEQPESRNEMAMRLREVVKREIENAERTEDPDYLGSVIEALKERLHTLHDIPNLGRYFFSAPDYSTQAAQQLFKSVPLPVYRQSLTSAIDLLSSLPSSSWCSHDEMLQALTGLIAPKQPSKEVMMPLRHALTGTKVGAGVPMTILTLGKEESSKRLQNALELVGRA